MARKSKAIPIIDPSTGMSPDSFTTPAVPALSLARVVPALPLLSKSFASNAAASSADNRPQITGYHGEGTTRVVKDEGESNRNGHGGSAVDAGEARSQSQSPIYAQGKKVDEAAAFNIYARPFVPKAFTVINTLPGPSISTPMRKGTNYDGYLTTSLGPAASFLPMPAAIGQQATSQHTLSLEPRRYEAFLQHHLRLEAKAEGSEVEACSLYGHDVLVKQAPDPLGKGQTLCTLKVPGLRENNPYVEEEDIVQLRQLRYGSDGSLLDMSVWLHHREAAGNEPWQEPTWQDPAPGWTNVIYFARVLGVVRSTETLHLRVLGLPPPASDRTQKFNVQFQLPVERQLPMCYALSEAQLALSQGGWLNSMLFPTNQDCEIQESLHPGVFAHDFFDRDLNWEQKKAVESIWSRSHGTLPYMISGPPGTGKTKTVIEAALQLVKNSAGYNHILLCAPSDPAADTLCQRLIGHLSPSQMLRLNRPCRTFAEVPDALLPFCLIQKDEFALPAFPVLMKYSVIVTTCRDASILARARMTNRDLYHVQKRMYEITRAIHPFQSHLEPQLHWSAVLIDEAAQAMEPEALIPLTIVAPPLDAARKTILHPPLFVMAGDEHQLGPRVSLVHSPLKESLFARLFKRPVYAGHPLSRGKRGEAPPPLTQSLLPVFRPAFANLIRNYRSHPAILAVPSKLFYFDSLEPEARDTGRLACWKGWQGRGWPVLFHDNQSLDELELPGLMEGTGGWYNPGEADAACSYAQSLVRSGLVEQKEVCIMSPFKAQVRHLRNRMRQPEYGGLWDVNIGPTEAFQGLERGVVILCVTRARRRFVQEDKKLGWGIIGMPNKMNVALTRAKYGLIVVGNRELLVEDPDWRAFLSFCDRNGLVTRTDATNGVYRQDGDSGGGQGCLTRLEKRLIQKEAVSVHMPSDRAWGILSGVQPGQEMWAGGMLETPELDEEETADYGPVRDA